MCAGTTTEYKTTTHPVPESYITAGKLLEPVDLVCLYLQRNFSLLEMELKIVRCQNGSRNWNMIQ